MPPQRHDPPPEAVVLALTRAGITRPTAMAMQHWKAQEVLDLLHELAVNSAIRLPGAPRRRGTLGTR